MPTKGTKIAVKTPERRLAGSSCAVEPFVEIVRLEVTAALPGVTEALEKLHVAFAGRLPHVRFTCCPKLEFTDETVTVIADVLWPLAVEAVVGATATEKSVGAAVILATNASTAMPYVV